MISDKFASCYFKQLGSVKRQKWHLTVEDELEAGAGDAESELYAKVIHPLDESIRRYLIHFTSVSPGVQGRLQRLTAGTKGP